MGPGKDTHGTPMPEREGRGGPQHDPQCDKRAQPKDRHHCLEQRTYWLYITAGQCRRDTTPKSQRHDGPQRRRPQKRKEQTSAWTCVYQLQPTNNEGRPHSANQRHDTVAIRMIQENRRSLTSGDRVHELIRELSSKTATGTLSRSMRPGKH